MSLLKQFLQYIKAENIFHPDQLLLLAVSGGLDSVVLCELCHQAGFDFVVAHVNFALRGPESLRDESFVRDLTHKYGKPFLTHTFDTREYAAEKKMSIQVAARQLRYRWFEDILKKRIVVDGLNVHPARQPSCIVTAHHQDDNVETLVMNFFKGTGIAGMRGILPRQSHLCRPLLFAKKEDLFRFANQHELKWVEDSSNESDRYTRNYFRNQILPLIEECYPRTLDNLANNIHRFREIEMLYNQSLDIYKKQLLEIRGAEIQLPILKLRKISPLVTVLYEILKDYQFTTGQIREVIDLMDSESGKYIQSATHRLLKNRNWLILSPLENPEAPLLLVEGTGQWLMGKWKLQVDMVLKDHFHLQMQDELAQLDADKIEFPLLVRKWKQGDYFYPLGMPKKKKIGRFLIDSKLSKNAKDNTWVIEMNKKIIWVVGLRIDDRYKITPRTLKILKIQVGMA